MSENTLKSGKCPNCGSHEVYTDHEVTKRGERMIIPITSIRRFFLDSYICISCGYVEEWIPERELSNRKLIDKVKQNWQKVNPI